MKKILPILILSFAVFAAILYIFSRENDLSAMNDVKAALEHSGYAVTVEEAEKDILQGQRYRLILNDDADCTVTVYVYENSGAAEKDAATITKDGFGVDKVNGLGIGESVRISWVSEPHFFLYENCIVQYIGMEFNILQTLQQLCGSQIAGQPFVDDVLICV